MRHAKNFYVDYTPNLIIREIDYYPEAVFLARRSIDVGKAVLVHNPIGFLSSRGFSGIEYQSLFNPNRFWMPNRLIGSGRLPVPAASRPVRPWTVRIFPVPGRKEIPLFLPVQSQTCKSRIESINKRILPQVQIRIKYRNLILKMSQKKKSYLGVPRGRICRDRFRRLWEQKSVVTGISGRGSAWRVLHRSDGTWSLGVTVIPTTFPPRSDFYSVSLSFSQ